MPGKSKIKTLDDIQRERSLREREESKERIADDIKDVMTKITTRDKPRKRSPIKTTLWILAFIFLLIIIVNFILLNIWALKFFIKNLFLG